MPDVPSDQMIKKALSITGRFEDSDNPFGAVSGNFDGMGISLGVLQWNIGSNSLQPLLRDTPEPTIKRLCPKCGADLLEAAKQPAAKGLDIVRAWQPGGILPPAYKKELRALAESKDFVEQQIRAANEVAGRANRKCVEWCGVWKIDPDIQAFCWFFDVYTQNGGVSSLTAMQVKEFQKKSSNLDMVIQWLQGRAKTESGYRDANRNAGIWSPKAMPMNVTLLFAASYLRSQLSRVQWRVDAMNRKGTLAIGHGWVHGTEWTIDFNAPPPD
ncbi:hypothetical protein [Caballeronia novacaledonica]|uniref:Uncharacterized protein n=1 Tax=Caballeronia novacaledonica TaxID=1544861 RepID=A0AA37MJV2_9BURK|nr:hypothetical protein [Caballeronia novacaledonica]GJH30193.1 hypothetical protein CBA19CS42_36775 [Caballeronia novacaledonica]